MKSLSIQKDKKRIIFCSKSDSLGPQAVQVEYVARNLEMCSVYETINLLFCEPKMTKHLHRGMPVLLLSVSSVNHRVPYVELQTALLIMATSQKLTQGVSCDLLLKYILEASTGWARKVAVTFGQNASSGLD